MVSSKPIKTKRDGAISAYLPVYWLSVDEPFLSCSAASFHAIRVYDFAKLAI